ncbi:UNVERIFIED_CONTAM: hypothetical protein GTU68_026269 [Idotea baltica]|nr:hypothetical protein [Idotea baltica]
MERNIVFIALFAALIAVLGFIPAITLGFGVPITAQTLGVMLCGTILGARRGALAVLLFLVLVLLGLPLLAGGRGGIEVLARPSVGFLIGWPVAAFVTGLIVEKVRSAPLGLVATMASIIGCIIVMYVFGIVGLALNLDKPLYEASLLVVAFIPGDIIKAVIAGLVTNALFVARPNSILSRTPVQPVA